MTQGKRAARGAGKTPRAWVRKLALLFVGAASILAREQCFRAKRERQTKMHLYIDIAHPGQSPGAIIHEGRHQGLAGWMWALAVAPYHPELAAYMATDDLRQMGGPVSTQCNPSVSHPRGQFLRPYTRLSRPFHARLLRTRPTHGLTNVDGRPVTVPACNGSRGAGAGGRQKHVLNRDSHHAF